LERTETMELTRELSIGGKPDPWGRVRTRRRSCQVSTYRTSEHQIRKNWPPGAIYRGDGGNGQKPACAPHLKNCAASVALIAKWTTPAHRDKSQRAGFDLRQLHRSLGRGLARADADANVRPVVAIIGSPRAVLPPAGPDIPGVRLAHGLLPAEPSFLNTVDPQS